MKILLVILMLMPALLLADGNALKVADLNYLEKHLCGIYSIIYSKYAVAIAAVATVIMGISVVNQKIQWSYVLFFAFALFLTFSSHIIVKIISFGKVDLSTSCLDADIVLSDVVYQKDGSSSNPSGLADDYYDDPGIDDDVLLCNGSFTYGGITYGCGEQYDVDLLNGGFFDFAEQVAIGSCVMQFNKQSKKIDLYRNGEVQASTAPPINNLVLYLQKYCN